MEAGAWVTARPGSGRLFWIDKPVALPAKCAVCGAGDDGRKYLDTQWSEDFYGVVYFCEYCFTEINNKLGWLSPDQEEILRGQVEALEKVNKDLLDEYAKYDDIRAVLDRYATGNQPNLGELSVRPEPTVQEERPVVAGSDRPERRPDKAPDKRDSGKGSNDTGDFTGEFGMGESADLF